MISTPKLSPTCTRFVSLLPNLSWANAKDIWSNMLAKEQFHTRNPLMMSRHSTLQPRTRSVLLNWLSEVSEVYQLHRETYFLAIDYFDRYLSIQKDIPIQQLQLIGVTCLFMAAKMEEIYPPKVADFAYVTDGACTEKQILTKELVILKSLKWNLNSMTVNSWLTIYMQLYSILEKEKVNKLAITNQQSVRSPSKPPPKKRRRVALTSSASDPNKQVSKTNTDESVINTEKKSDQSHKVEKNEENKDQTVDDNSIKNTFISTNLKSNKEQEEDDDFMFQKFNSFFYAQIAHLVDLSMLDIGSLRFPYNVISASALYHFTNMPTVIQCTGLRSEQVQECILWMTPFALAIRDEGFDLIKYQKSELIEKMSYLQIHTVDLKLFDKAQLRFQQVLAERNSNNFEKSTSSNENDTSKSSLSSPLKNSSTILTPPRSNSKQSKV